MPMRRTTLVIILLSFVTVRPAPGASEPDLPRLSAAEAQEDVTLLRRALVEIHAGYGRYTSAPAMEALLDGLARDVEDGVDVLDLLREISRVLAFVRCDHTLAEVPPALESHRRLTPSHLPFTFRLFDGRMYIDRAGAAAGTLARGDEVIAIDGRAVGRILADVIPLVSIDGWTDDVKPVTLEHSTELLGGAIDHFWPALYGWPDRWQVTVRRATGDVETVGLAPVTYDDWLSLAVTEGTRWLDFADSVELERLAEPGTFRLTIGTFVNYRRPVAPPTIFDPVFDRLREAGATHLIIDLRSCGGGSTDVPDALLTYLTDARPPAARRPPWTRTTGVGDLRPFLSTWDDAVFDLPREVFVDQPDGFYELQLPGGWSEPVPARPNRFTGRVTLLIGPANSSGATVFAALLDEHVPEIRLVGEPTGGSAEGPTAGTIAFLELPHSKIRVRIPLVRSWVNVTHPEPGLGVAPDILVRPTVDDWRAGQDVVLEAAVAP